MNEYILTFEWDEHTGSTVVYPSLVNDGDKALIEWIHTITCMDPRPVFTKIRAPVEPMSEGTE